MGKLTWACARKARFSPGYHISGFQPWGNSLKAGLHTRRAFSPDGMDFWQRRPGMTNHRGWDPVGGLRGADLSFLPEIRIGTGNLPELFALSCSFLFRNSGLTIFGPALMRFKYIVRSGKLRVTRWRASRLLGVTNVAPSPSAAANSEAFMGAGGKPRRDLSSTTLEA